MKVYFRGKETIVKDLDYIGPDEEKDSKVYEKCLNAYFYIYIYRGCYSVQGFR